MNCQLLENGQPITEDPLPYKLWSEEEEVTFFIWSLVESSIRLEWIGLAR